MASSLVTDEDSSEPVQKAPRRRKCKNHLMQLLEMFPDVSYQVAAVYGSTDDQIYVMEVKVGEKVFQGIGPSKIKAKIMAAELALINHGAIEALTLKPTDVTDICSSEDFSADCTESQLFYDFSKLYPATDEFASWDVGNLAESGVGNSAIPSADDGDIGEVDDEDLWSRFVGKTSLTIVVELQLDARYELLAETRDQLHPLFAMAATIDGETFRAAGTSKKLAKARAARNALSKLYNLEFGTAENGIPIYEGNEDIWQSYKEKLEKEAELLIQPGRNPLLVMADVFPEAVYELGDGANTSHFYTAKVTVLEKSYSGLGTTKTDAKTNAAANALEELHANGSFASRELTLKRDRQRSLFTDKQMSALQYPDSKLSGANKNAVAKLNILFRDRVRFCDLSETPVRHTSFTAFTVAVSVDGRHHIGVGKTKKAARNAAAERALKSLLLWTDEDESVKFAATMEVDEDPVVAVYRMQEVIAQEREMHSLEQAEWNRFQHSQWNQDIRGSFQWNPDVRGGGVAPGRGRRNGAGWRGEHRWGAETWSGPRHHGPVDWIDQETRGWNQSAHEDYFASRRGRPSVPQGRGIRGGGYPSETFQRNTPDTLSTNTRDLQGRNVRNRGGRVLSGRGDSGKTRFEKPFPPGSGSTQKMSSSSLKLTPEVPSPALPPQFASNPNPPSVTPWSFTVDPTAGTLQSATNQNQPATQAPGNYLPADASYYVGGPSYHNTDMTYAANAASGGFMQPGSSDQTALLMYGAYGVGTGYDSVYGPGAYSSY